MSESTARHQLETSQLQANNFEFSSLPIEVIPETPKQKAETILAASGNPLHIGIDNFLHNGSTFKLLDARYGESTPGGTALGSSENRTTLVDRPDLIREAVGTRLEEVIRKSSDKLAKSQASSKNSAEIADGFWTTGDFVHSTGYGSLGPILGTGLLCSELHGSRAKNDTTPLEADFSEIVDRVDTLAQATANEQSTYSADRGGNTSVLLKFRRAVGSTDYGEDSTGNLDNSPGHRTIFVGVPSTEISGVQVVGVDADKEAVIASIIKHGQYIPVYDSEDQLILTPEEFEITSGVDIKEVDEMVEASETVSQTKKQVSRMAEKLYMLGKKSEAWQSQFVHRHTWNNAKFTNSIETPVGNIYLNTQYEKGESLQKASISLDNNRVLHVWEKDDGEMDMFVSQLDGEAKQVVETDLPEIRKDLAKVFSVSRARMTTQRIQNKEIAKKREAEASNLF